MTLSPANRQILRREPAALPSAAIRLLLLPLLLILSALPALGQGQNQPPLTAFVDRDEVSLNEIITLTIRVDSQLGNARPVLSGLDENFQQLGVATTNRYTSLNGNVQSWTEYEISIKPKNSGTLVIPSFRVGGDATRPITVTVGEATRSTDRDEEIFLRTEVDKDEIYVQEQLLFTIRIYYAVNFNQGAQLSSPQVENSVVQQLGSDQTYQELVDGITYNVVERKFVVFPQGSGQLSIPPVYFTAQVGGRGINLLRQRNARQINLTSDTHQVQVKPVPAGFPGETWLPASSLRITEQWSGGTEGLSVGDSVTRNLALRAEGLSSSLLPGIEYQDIPGLKFYPDQPVREDDISRDGITGNRAEGTAIVPSEAGEYLLPEIRLPWWNTNSDRLEYATVPAHSLSVVRGAAGSQPQPSQLNFGPGAGDQGVTSTPGSAALNPFWVAVTALLAGAWLFTTLLWLRGRRQLAYAGRYRGGPLPPAPAARTADESLPDLDAAFRHLREACRDNELREVKQAAIHWGQAFFRNRNIRTLDHLRGYCDNPTLSALLFNLEQALYSEHEPRDFRCAQLLKEVSALHRSGRPGKAAADYRLPPLYRN